MAEYKLILPAMGEGVLEATITGWLKNVGDAVAEDESIVEIATDKVDSDVPSPVGGILVKRFFELNEVAKVGEIIAIVETNQTITEEKPVEVVAISEYTVEEEVVETLQKPLTLNIPTITSTQEKFFSPLVKSIAAEEGILEEELHKITGSGQNKRITKDDILTYLDNKKKGIFSENKVLPILQETEICTESKAIIATGEDEIIEMDRMRKLISKYMKESQAISAHVTSFIETDVTQVVEWRTKNKDAFAKREGENLTYMPVFVQAIVKAIKDYPMINISVDGDKIIRKKNINIGFATALPNGNLIVPVVKNADQLSLAGLAKKINDLANRARKNLLKPDEIQGGTYTISNIGGFGNLMGTPIINQPQVAVMAVGAIQKKPAVIETPSGDFIGIRHKMFISHAYDHRVIDGALGGMFLKKVSDYIENFDVNTEI